MEETLKQGHRRRKRQETCYRFVNAYFRRVKDGVLIQKQLRIIMKKKGIKLVTACADGDSNKQKEQVSTMITHRESMY